jgi:hypothetical protein
MKQNNILWEPEISGANIASRPIFRPHPQFSPVQKFERARQKWGKVLEIL